MQFGDQIVGAQHRFDGRFLPFKVLEGTHRVILAGFTRWLLSLGSVLLLELGGSSLNSDVLHQVEQIKILLLQEGVSQIQGFTGMESHIDDPG